MRNYIIVLLLFLVAIDSSGQVPGCEVSGSPDLTFFDLSTQGTHTPTTLKIYFNIVRDINGDGGYDPSRIPFIISEIDAVFNPHGISFEYVCDDIFVDDTDLATQGAQDNFWCDWFDPSVPRHTDGIDIFIVTGFHPGSFAGRVSTIPGKFMVLNGGTGGEANQFARIESTTVVHELGHLFGLLHMWHGSTQNQAQWTDLGGTSCSSFFGVTDCGRQFTCPYSASFSNCVTGTPVKDENECAEGNSNGGVAGDYIPDTAPSHRLVERFAALACSIDVSMKVTNDAAQHPNAPEILTPNGTRYNPDITNFMSTSIFKDCRDNFSPNQVTVMKNHIQSHPILSSVHSTKGSLICDCDYENIIYLRETKNWSAVITEQGISSTQLTDFEIVVEEDLIIDQSYAFENVTFTFNTDSDLTIANSAVSFTGNANGRTSLSSCSGRWEGVKVGGASDVIFAETDIDNTKDAIVAEGATDLKIDDVTIVNTSQNGIVVESGASLDLDGATIFGLSGTSSTGISLRQGSTASSIKDFTIQDFDYGLRGRNLIGTTSIVDGTITNSDAGIWLRGTLPIIDEVDINNAFFGMYIDQSPGGVITNTNVNSLHL